MASYFDASTLNGFDLSSHDTVTKGLVFNSLVCMAVVVLVITLRLYVRHFIKHAIGLDDCKSHFAFPVLLGSYLAIFQAFSRSYKSRAEPLLTLSSDFAAAAAASAVVLTTCCLFAAAQGLGKHIWDLGIDIQAPSSAHASLRISIPLYICYLSYLVGNTLVKCSIIASYYRLFPGQTFRRLLLVLNGLVVLTCISSILAIIFECYPIKSSWDWFSPIEKCINILRFFFVSSMISTITDIVIWGCPLPQLFKLQMKPTRKLQLVLLFGAGAL
jgi:hypothetical protein